MLDGFGMAIVSCSPDAVLAVLFKRPTIRVMKEAFLGTFFFKAVQGDQSGCSLGVVDAKTKIVLYCKDLILKRQPLF